MTSRRRLGLRDSLTPGPLRPRAAPPRRDHTDLEAKIAIRSAAPPPHADGWQWHLCAGSGLLIEAMSELGWPPQYAIAIDRDAAQARRCAARCPAATTVCGDAETALDSAPPAAVVDIDPYGGSAHLIRAAALGLTLTEPSWWAVTDGAGMTRARQGRPWDWDEMRMGARDSDRAREQQRAWPVECADWMTRRLGLAATVVAAEQHGRMWYALFRVTRG